MSQPPQTQPKPLSVEELYDRSVAAANAGRPGEAEQLLRIAFKVARGAQLMVTLGIALDQQRRFAEAREIFRAAMKVTPDEPGLGFPLALNLLRDGDYAEGWPLYEAREVKMAPGVVGRPKLSFPEWGGEPVKSLLVLPEQGLGDEIMFNRYIPALKARGIEVTLLCRPPLTRLFQHLEVRLLPLGPTVEVPRCDAWVLATSLPLRFGTTPQTVPDPVYLPGPAEGPTRGRVGLMAASSASGQPRWLPKALAEDLLARPGMVSLDPRDSGVRDFEDTRAIVEGLDLVISVDTAVAHLAGAMGRPCWVLLPFVADWRWGRGQTSPWYPRTRLFRQPAPGDWPDVIAQVKAALAERAAA